MFCCGTKQRKSFINEKKENMILLEATHFTEKDLRELRQYKWIKDQKTIQSTLTKYNSFLFQQMSNNTGFLTNTQFRDCMGILGLENVQFLSDRIFNIMANPSGQVSFHSYITYLNTMMNGEEKEKILLSYQLIDYKNVGYFMKEDLSVMIKSIVNSWVAITQITLSKEMLSNVDRQVNHIFKVMDTKKQDKVDSSDFLLALSTYPDLLEIFDFLNKGVTDTVLNNESRQRELQIAREIFSIEKYLENINAYLVGDINYLQDISQSNQDQFFQKTDLFNKDSSIKRPSIQETSKKLNPTFGKQNERQFYERDRERYDMSNPFYEKGLDVSNQNTLHHFQSTKKIGNQYSTKTLGQDYNTNTAKNIQQSKFDIHKKNITHSLSVDLKNKIKENQSNYNDNYINTDQDYQNQQNSNYRSNLSDFGSNYPRKQQDGSSENFNKKEEDERAHKKNDHIDDISNNSNLHPLSPFSKQQKQSSESNISSNANIQSLSKKQPANATFGMISNIGQNRFSQRSNSVYNNQTSNHNDNLLKIPTLDDHRYSKESMNQLRVFSMNSNNSELDTIQFMTFHNKQSQVLLNQPQSKLNDISEGDNQSQNENDTLNATFQNQNQKNLNQNSSQNADTNKIGIQFQMPLKNQEQSTQSARYYTPQHQNQEQMQKNKSKLNQQTQSQVHQNLTQNDEETILKKYEDILCVNCVYNLTQKFKQDQYKDSRKLNSLHQQKRFQFEHLNAQSLTPRSKIQQRHMFSTQSMQKHLNESTHFYDRPNTSINIQLNNIAQRFLGDIDDAESCCIGSDDDENKKSDNQVHLSPRQILSASAYQLNPQNANHLIKYRDSAKLKKQKQFQNEKSSPKIKDFNIYDSQLKNEQKEIDRYNNQNKQSENKFFTEESTSRQMRIFHDQLEQNKCNDQNDNYTISSNEQIISPRTYNMLAFYEKVEKTNFGERNDGRFTQQVSVPSNLAQKNQNALNVQQNAVFVGKVSNQEKKQPLSQNKIFSKTNFPESGQTIVSIDNATDVNHLQQPKCMTSNNNPSQHQQVNGQNTNAEDIEIEISANAIKVGKKFMKSELSIREVKNQNKNIEQRDVDKYHNDNNNALNGQQQTDPTKLIYVDNYKNNNKNTPTNSQTIMNPSNSNTTYQNSNSNRRVINASNIKTNTETNSENNTYNNTLIQTPSLLKKLEFDQMTNSLSHDISAKLQFGNKNSNEKQLQRNASKDLNYQVQQDNTKYSSKNIDLTGTTAAHYNCHEVPEQEQYYDSSENLLNQNKNSNQKSNKKQPQENYNNNNKNKIEDPQEQKQQNECKKSSTVKATSSNENNAQKKQGQYNIDKIQRNYTDSPFNQGSTYNQKDSQNNDYQLSQKRVDQSEYQNAFSQIHMRQSIQNNLPYNQNLHLKLQNAQYNNKNQPRDQYQAQSSLMATQSPINYSKDRSSNIFYQFMEMGVEELRRKIQQFAQTIRKNIESNTNNKISDKQSSNIFNGKRSQENKNRKTCIIPQNKGAQQLNLSVQGRFQASQSHYLNQSGINFTRPPPQQYNQSEEDNLRISTIGNIQKKQVKEKEPKKGKLMVFFGHENWNLVVNMMMGIQMSVQSAASNLILNENEPYPEMQNRDFKVKYLFELLPRKDNFEKEWTYKVCKFQDYAPNVFQRIRRFYNISDEQYLKSLGPNQLFSFGKGGLKSFSQLTSTGKSGSFFYYTADGQFTLKTVSRTEFHHLKLILKNYYEHVKDNRNTLIIKFFGLHKIKIRMKKSSSVEIVYIVIMGNVFHTTKLINQRYDLKGSTYGRTTKVKAQGVTLKDLDFIENKQKILAKYDEYEEFMNVVKKDAKFFEENNIIDYSMLVGIHNNTPQSISFS